MVLKNWSYFSFFFFICEAAPAFEQIHGVGSAKQENTKRLSKAGAAPHTKKKLNQLQLFRTMELRGDTEALLVVYTLVAKRRLHVDRCVFQLCQFFVDPC
jgi:hypothetical protein